MADLVLCAVSGAAWAVVLVAAWVGSASLPELCTARLIQVPGRAELTFVLSWLSPGAVALSWVLMLLAMMFPLLISPVAHVLRTSFRHTRVAAVAAFVVAYLTVWMLVGAGLIVVSLALAAAFGAAAGLVAFGLAVVWQCVPAKQSALNRCHGRPPLAGVGDAAKFGGQHALWCAASCAPIMLFLLVSVAFTELVMVLAALWIWAERIEPPAAPKVSPILPKRILRVLVHHATRVPSQGRIAQMSINR